MQHGSSLLGMMSIAAAQAAMDRREQHAVEGEARAREHALDRADHARDRELRPRDTDPISRPSSFFSRVSCFVFGVWCFVRALIRERIRSAYEDNDAGG